MILLMDNAEVRTGKVACPSPESLEATCQLLGLPFRHERACGVFAVKPPLLGRRILVVPVAAETVGPGPLGSEPSAGYRGGPERRLLAEWVVQLRVLHRLLWVCGADVSTGEPRLLERRTGRSAEQAFPLYWDLALFAVPGQAVSGEVRPLAVYPWWHWGVRSWRLAGEVSADGPFRRMGTLSMAPGLKRWYAEMLSNTPCPSVLLSVPLVEGYADSLLHSLALTVCRAVLRYYHKPLIAQSAAEALQSEAAAVPAATSSSAGTEVLRESAGAQAKAGTSRRQDLEASAGPDVAVGLPAAGLSDEVHRGARSLQAEPEVSKVPDASRPETKLMERAPGRPFEKSAENPSDADGIRDTGAATGMASTKAQDLRSLATARRAEVSQTSARKPAQTAQAFQAQADVAANTPGTPLVQERALTRDEGTAVQQQRPVPPSTQNQYAMSQPGPLPSSLRDSEEVRQLRRMLLESSDLVMKQARDVLSARGIQPTPERVEEYVSYLRRMLLPSQPESREG